MFQKLKPLLAILVVLSTATLVGAVAEVVTRDSNQTACPSITTAASECRNLRINDTSKGLLMSYAGAETGAGSMPVNGATTPADAFANPTTAVPSQALAQVWNGGTWDRWRAANLANSTVATTLTARNSIGAGLSEKGSRWAVFANPAVSTQATAAIAAEASVRHVVDCISFAAGSTVAPALTALTVNLRDGATGAGTILQTWQVIVPAATGQNVAPFGVCGLNLVGTTNTAMTLEFSALLTNLLESTSMTGYNIN